MSQSNKTVGHYLLYTLMVVSILLTIATVVGVYRKVIDNNNNTIAIAAISAIGSSCDIRVGRIPRHNTDRLSEQPLRTHVGGEDCAFSRSSLQRRFHPRPSESGGSPASGKEAPRSCEPPTNLHRFPRSMLSLNIGCNTEGFGFASRKLPVRLRVACGAMNPSGHRCPPNTATYTQSL
jgi:hypothetical protein